MLVLRDGMGQYQLKDIRFGARRLQAVAALQLNRLDKASKLTGELLSDPELPGEDLVEAILVRAEILKQQGDLDGAIEALDSVLAMAETSTAQREQGLDDLARCLFLRSVRHSRVGDFDAELLDLDRAAPAAPFGKRIAAAIRVNRAVLHMKLNRFDLAEQDCSEVIEHAVSPSDQQVKALINRAQMRLRRRDWDGTASDLQRALQTPELTEGDRVPILLVRSQLK